MKHIAILSGLALTLSLFVGCSQKSDINSNNSALGVVSSVASCLQFCGTDGRICNCVSSNVSVSPALSFHSWGTQDGAISTTGTADGFLSTPTAVAVHPAGKYLYVADSTQERISRYDLTTGSSEGWIGTYPSTSRPQGGDTGCTSLALNNYTPGWCKGGLSGGTGIKRFVAPRGLAIDGTGAYLYLSTGDYRIIKINAETGQYIGWIGKIGTQPSGGATGCSATPAGSITPGWCIGGAPQAGYGIGAFLNQEGIFVSGNYLYVVDTYYDPMVDSIVPDYRVYKFNASTGAFISWTGKAVSSTGWTSSLPNPPISSPYTGSTYWPSAIVVNSSVDSSVDSSQNFYLASANAIYKYNSNGILVGWTGQLTLPRPQSGALGCTDSTLPEGSPTPGWCIGGRPFRARTEWIPNDGSFLRISQMSLESYGGRQYLYAADKGLNRIAKLDAVSGKFLGWVGLVDHRPDVLLSNQRPILPPDGGACANITLSIGTPTPGWCAGGNSTQNTSFFLPHLEGTTYRPVGIAVFNGTLFVSENLLGRISRYNSDTGAYEAWLGGSQK